MAKIEIDALSMAQRFIDNHGFSAAELVIHEHLKTNRDDVAAFAMLAEIYEKLSRLDLAVQAYRNALLIAGTKRDTTAVARFEAALSKIEGQRAAWELNRTAERERAEAAEAERKNQSARSVVDNMARRISPYFGYPEVAGGPLGNNYGFCMDVDYPYRAADDEFVVGIFGGSVAAGLHREGSAILSRRLTALPAIRGRRVVVLNFAAGGSKQPEAMLNLAYFTAIGQKLDLVVNIDGQNDVLGYAKNLSAGHHIAMPLHELTDAFSNLTAAIGLDAQSLDFFSRLSRLDHWIEQCDSSNIPGAALVSATLKRRRTNLVANKPAVSGKVNLLHVQRTRPVRVFKLDDRDFDNILDQFAEFWFSCARNMVRLCDGMDIPYIHALHPSPYLRRRALGPKDAAMAASANLAIFERTIRRGFPKLAALGKTFHELSDSAHYCDMLDILEDMGDGMLYDPYGHFNPFVYEAMADKLADFIANVEMH